MSVYDFCYMAINDGDDVQLYSFDAGETVFEGTFDEAAYGQYADEEVQSFGVENGIMVLNIA